MYPELIYLRPQETKAVEINGIERIITLIGVEESWEPHCWVPKKDNDSAKKAFDRTLYEAKVTLKITNSQKKRTYPCILYLRPYQQPIEIDGLAICIDATYNWAVETKQFLISDTDPNPNLKFFVLEDMESYKDGVRLSICDSFANWGPADLVFPICDYRWRSSSYQNTWSSLVPYNDKLYYHWGEDFGAIPDKLAVVAMMGGEVTKHPMNASSPSTSVEITSEIAADKKLTIAYNHMNWPQIEQHLLALKKRGVSEAESEQPFMVEIRDVLGKTGATSREGHQWHDPHLHISFYLEDTQTGHRTTLNPYPFLLRAYFNSYPDALIAIAGGYRFARVGQTVELDGNRSVARPEKEIAEYTWVLSDGRRVHDAKTKITYDAPGLYSEELIVRTPDGQEDRDYLQVRVYDRDIKECYRDYGWVYHSPVRGIKPGQPIEFSNQLKQRVSIDFGDGSPIKLPSDLEDKPYQYQRPGIYTVTFSNQWVTATAEPAASTATSSRSLNPDEPVTVKMRIVVE